VNEGIVSEADADQNLIIAAVWVNPAATDAEKVYTNNRTATREALRAGAAGTPRMAEVLIARHRPFNPFYSPPSGGPEPVGDGGQETAEDGGQAAAEDGGQAAAEDGGQAAADEGGQAQVAEPQ